MPSMSQTRATSDISGHVDALPRVAPLTHQWAGGPNPLLLAEEPGIQIS